MNSEIRKEIREGGDDVQRLLEAILGELQRHTRLLALLTCQQQTPPKEVDEGDFL